jgi:hypothetical protein
VVLGETMEDTERSGTGYGAKEVVSSVNLSLTSIIFPNLSKVLTYRPEINSGTIGLAQLLHFMVILLVSVAPFLSLSYVI